MTTDTAFIIPVYNEATVIRSVISEVLKQYKYVVCVNDGSRDNSADEIAMTSAYLIEHPINMGQGAALQTGVEFARELPVDFFVTYDADGQHRLEDVKSMLKIIRSNTVDIVLGSRFLGSEAINMPTTKKMLLKFAVMFSNLTSGLRLTDTHNGLRVFNRRVAEAMQITVPDMAHASEILEMINRNKWRYAETPVVIEYTDYSLKKGQSFMNAVNIAFDTLLRKVGR